MHYQHIFGAKHTIISQKRTKFNRGKVKRQSASWNTVNSLGSDNNFSKIKAPPLLHHKWRIKMDLAINFARMTGFPTLF